MVIESLGVYLPPDSVTSCEVLAGCRKRILFPLEQVTGIRSRRVAHGEFSLDLAAKAVSDCLARSKYQPEDIDLLICCNISRYDAPNAFTFEPSSAVSLSARFGFGSALTFDVSNACAGVFTGIYLAQSFIKAGAAQRVMVVSGEYITHLTRTAQNEMKGFLDPQLASLTLGDSGIAIVLEASPESSAGFSDIELYTLGKYSRYCVAQVANGPAGGAKMITDSVKLSSVAITEATSHGIEMQEHYGWKPEVVDHFIMHQTSARTIRDAMGRVNNHYGKAVCTSANTHINVGERGNTATTSHFVALKDGAVAGKIKSGDSVIFSVNASGLTVGGAKYVCDDLPTRLQPDYLGEKVGAGVRQPFAEPGNRLPGIGIESIGFADLNSVELNDTMAMGASAARSCLQLSKYPTNDIDVLIYAGVYRTDHVCEPAIAAMLAGDLAMNDHRNGNGRARTLCFDVLAGAASTLKSCCIAARLIQSGKARRVMVVASEVVLNPELGIEPSGSAMILERAEGDSEGAPRGFSGFVFKDLPERSKAFSSTCDLSTPGGRIEFRRDPQLERYYLVALGDLVTDYVLEAGLAPSDVKLILAPQISSCFLHALGLRLDMPGRVLDAIGTGGDLYTSSLASTFQAALNRGLVNPGDLALCLTAASGIQVGCALYRF